MNRTKNVFVLLLVWILVAAAAHAQNTYEVVDTNEDAVVLRVAQGFTPWGFWASNADTSVCGWADFYPAVAALNPAEVATNFRTIAVGSDFRVPSSCAAGEAVASNELLSSFSSMLEETREGIVAVVAEARGELNTRLDEQGERISALEDGYNVIGDQLVALETSVESSFAELSDGDEAQGATFWQRIAPWQWVLLILLLALIVATVALWWRNRNESNGRRMVWRDTIGTGNTERQQKDDGWRKENARLREDQKSLGEKNERLREEHERLQQKNAQLREERDELKEKSVRAEGDLEEFKVENEEGKTRIVTLKHVDVRPKVVILDPEGNELSGTMYRDNVLKNLKRDREKLERATVRKVSLREGSEENKDPVPVA